MRITDIILHSFYPTVKRYIPKVPVHVHTQPCHPACPGHLMRKPCITLWCRAEKQTSRRVLVTLQSSGFQKPIVHSGAFWFVPRHSRSACVGWGERRSNDASVAHWAESGSDCSHHSAKLSYCSNSRHWDIVSGWEQLDQMCNCCKSPF